jgi:endonuclease III
VGLLIGSQFDAIKNMPNSHSKISAYPDVAVRQPFDIDAAMARIEAAVRPYPQAALFELAERGHTSAFEQLVACIISIRTRDEVMLPTALRLFETAPTPAAMSELSPQEIDAHIASCTFHEGKAQQIHEIARRVVSEYSGVLPCDAELLLSLRGVGPKCANLVLGIACQQPYIGVDIHVHRVTNRWGYVETKTPEKTMAALMEKLPPEYRVEINKLLVPFGKHICTGALPRCSTCPVLEMCQQVGVTAHR